MSLTEILVLKLGPVIAKSVLKFWLRDSELGQDVASEFLDLLKAKTADTIAQERAKNQFEQIGISVAESLQDIFEIEGARLDEGDRNAIAEAVAYTLGEARIDARLLAQKDLDAGKLADHLIQHQPKDVITFSDDATSLYKRILIDSSQAIIEIASQLPLFNELMFAEMLKRGSALLDVTQKVLDELLRVRNQSWEANPEIAAARFERDYCRAVVHNLDELELFGTDLPNRRYRLKTAYVTLSVREYDNLDTSDDGDTESKTEEDIKWLDPARGLLPDIGREDLIDLSVERVLLTTQRLVIRGLPGSGKSTLLQWIAVHSASHDFDEPLFDWNNSVPFLIRLREFTERPLPAPEEFPSLVAKAIAGKMPYSWVHSQLQTNRGIVLIDGVDEVPKGRRADVRAWVKDLVLMFPLARVIITSRHHAVQEGWLDSEGFMEAELQPMDMTDINSFIDQWHQAVSEELHYENEKLKLIESAEQLKIIIRDRRPIRNLATNPLLCALLCALYRVKGSSLPTGRLELYRVSCEMLLHRRDMEQSIDFSKDYPDLTYEQKLSLLQDLAYFMLKNRWPQAPKHVVQARFARKLRNLINIPMKATSASVTELLVHRSGVIREPVMGEVDFIHRSFQEYLAAQALLDEGDTGLLIQNAHDDQWREVAILAAGLATLQTRNKLIKGLIARGDHSRKHRQRTVYAVAVASLETCVELDSGLRKQLEERLRRIAPPRNTTEAHIVAAAGPVVIPYLLYQQPPALAPLGDNVLKAFEEKSHAQMLAGCVRALGLIGGPAALRALRPYAQDSREEVVTEVYRARHQFEHDAYAQEILPLLQLGRVNITRATSLEDLRLLPRVRILNLNMAGQPLNMSQMRDLPELTELTLTGSTQLLDLSPLARFTELQYLRIGGCIKLTDVRPLGNLRNLNRLVLDNCQQLAELQPLTTIRSLQLLRLTSSKQLANLSPIAELEELIVLMIRNCSIVDDLTPLRYLPELSSLSLSGCTQISDISPVADLSTLEGLDLRECSQVKDLRPLTGLRNLVYLDLRGCEAITDLSGLTDMPSLRYIRFPEKIQVPAELRGKSIKQKRVNPVQKAARWLAERQLHS